MGGTDGKTVLVVEDDRANLMLMGDVLVAHGYRVLQANHARAGLNLAKEHRPDLILMDIRLPEVSGLSLTRTLKSDKGLRKIPVVAVTAYAMSGDRDRALTSGCQAYLAKPFTCDELIDTVHTIIGPGAGSGRPGSGRDAVYSSRHSTA